MTDILFRLEADPSGAIRGFVLTKDQLDKLKQTTEQTSAAQAKGAGEAKKHGDAVEQAGQKATGADRAMQSLKRAVAAVFTAATIKQAIDYADTMTNLEGRLKIATSSEEALARARVATFEISQRTSTALESTIELYTRLELSLKGNGVAQENILRVTETLNKAIQASGASATEANAAIIQLSQGLAAGALRGDEFRSVAEQSPRILQALQDSLDKTRGELKNLADEGKLTTEIIVQALLEQSGTIAAEYDKLPLTVGRAMTQLRNEVLQYVDGANDATGATGALANFIILLSKNLETLVNLGLAAAVAGLTAFIAKAYLAGTATAAFSGAVAALLSPLGLLVTALGLAAFAFLQYQTNAGEAERSANNLATAVENAASRVAASDAILAAHTAIQDRRLEIERLREEMVNLASSAKTLENDRPDIAGNMLEGAENMKAKIAELEAQIAKYQEVLDKAKGKTEEWKNAAGGAASAAALLAQQQAEASKAAKQYADAVKIAEDAVLKSGSAEEKIAVLRERHKRALAELKTELAGTADGAKLYAAAEAALDKQLAATTEKILEEGNAADILNQKIEALRQTVVDTSEQAFLQLELQLEEVTNQFGENSVQAETLRNRILELRLQLDNAAQAAQAAAPQVDGLTKAFERGIERLDDLGAELWRGWFTGATSALDSIKNYFLGWLAEMANAAITRPIIVQLGAALGIPSLAQAAGGAGGAAAGGGGATGWAGLVSMFTGNGIGAAFGSLGASLPTWLGGTAGTGLLGPTAAGGNIAGGIFANAGNFANWQYGLTGILAGIIGDKLFGGYGGAGSGIGATLGLAIGGPIGALLGGLAGGALGGLFGKDRPAVLDISTRSQAGESNSDDDRFFDSLLGGFNTRSRRIDDATINQFGNAIAEFDNQLAALMDPEQLQAATEALKAWELQLEGEAISLETFLNSRFGVILTTFSDEVQEYVNAASDLEGRLERLGLVVAIEQFSEAFPDLFDSLASGADLIKELQDQGESVQDALLRVLASVEIVSQAFDVVDQSLGVTGEQLVRFAEEFTDAAGGVQRAASLWAAYFENFYEADDALENRLRIARAAAAQEFEDIGIPANLSGEQFRELFESVLPTLSGEALAQWLEAAEALGILIGLEEELAEVRLSGDLEQALADQIEYIGELRQAFDGSAESVVGLQRALGLLDQIIEAINVSFDAAAGEISSITGGLIEKLRRETLTNEQIFDEIRAQALGRAGDISSAGSREELVDIIREITDLTAEARGLVDGTEINDELIAFLETITQNAQIRLEELREDALSQARAEAEAAEAMLEFSTAVDTFAAAVAFFNGSQIPAPGSAGVDNPVGAADASAAGSQVVDAGAFNDAIGAFRDAVSDFVGAASDFSVTTPDVRVDVEVNVDQAGNSTSRSEVGLA